jgi:hypothetical protein
MKHILVKDGLTDLSSQLLLEAAQSAGLSPPQLS